MLSYTDINNRYDDIVHIGSGSYGNVYRVFDKKSNEYYAMKLTYIDDNFIIRPTTLREISNLQKIKNNYIIALKDISFGIFYKRKCIYLILELCDITLFHNFEKNNYEIEIFNKITEIIGYLHYNGFYHGDLSFLNIMINSNANVKLIDMGTMRRSYRKYDIDYKPSLMVQPIEFLNGSYNKDKINGKSVDIWSLGCIYYKFKTREYLIDPIRTHYRRSFMARFKRISKHPKLNDLDKHLLNNFLKINPKERIILENNTYKLNVNNYTIKRKKNNIFDIIDQTDKFNILLYFDNFIKMNNIENEVLFLTIINSKKISKKNCENKKEILIWFVILFWLSNQIVSVNILSKDDIYSYLSSIGLKITNVSEIYYTICQKLKWDVDGNTMYNFIEYIPNEVRFLYEGLIMYLEITSYSSDNLIRTLGGIYEILKENYDLSFDKLDSFLNSIETTYNYRYEGYKIKMHIKNNINKSDDLGKFIACYFEKTNNLYLYNNIWNIAYTEMEKSLHNQMNK